MIPGKNKKKKIIIFLKFASLGAVLLGIFGAGTLWYYWNTLPPLQSITTRQVAQSTKILDRTGEVLLYEITNGEKRTVIPFEEIPEVIKNATISIEDEAFYRGPVFDWRGIVRSLWRNLGNLGTGRPLQGGSTITQQLAKNAFLSAEQTYGRKIRELMLAIQLDRSYSKDEILALYLNEIPYGSTLYGIEAATQAYFRKSAKDVTLAEAAILSALPKAPSYFSPWGSHMSELIERQHFILKKMLADGKIDGQQLEAALAEELTFYPQLTGIIAPHFVVAVQDELVEQFGEEAVRTGGLRVITTLDIDLQSKAEEVVASGAARNEELYGGTNAALVAEDARTGEILALVGSRDYFDVEREGNFNVALQGLRQPGSALKPFVYLAAFLKGYTPETVLFDVPTEFAANSPECPLAVSFLNEEDACFHPQNFDERFRGPVSFRRALAQSINVPAVKALYLAGLSDTLKTLNTLGITTLTDPARYGLSLVLGGGEVRLAELVHAYATLATEGEAREQIMIREVIDSKGRELLRYEERAVRAIPEEPVRMINDILTDIGERSGLFQASLSLTLFPGHEVALKTGTTNDYRDAWAFGYTPSLVVGVWAGNNDNTPMKARGSSILAAIPMWSEFMGHALQNFPQETFLRPEPASAPKPILRGDYSFGYELHNILHYVEKENPLGPIPTNPTEDSQYANWEFGVLRWAEQNIPDFHAHYNIPGGGGILPGSEPLSLELKEPGSGAFIQGNVTVRAAARSSAGIVTMRMYLNGVLIQEWSGAFGNDYELNWTFEPQNALAQNILAVEAVDAQGTTRRAEAIVYKR